VNWIGAFVVSPCWGWSSTQLFLQAWLAYADLFIAIVSLARGRMTRSRATGAIFAALASGVVCSVLLRGGFGLLVEVMDFGRTGLEKVLCCLFVALSALYMLPQLPSKVQNSWRAAMSPDSGTRPAKP
jgi:hypothetical protein